MNIKSIFPQTQNITYLNTAACGLMSKNVLEVKQKENLDFFEQGSTYLQNEDVIVKQAKQSIADIFNAKIDRIAISANFTLAFNAVLDALEPTHSFLCLTEDYPSLLLPIKKRFSKYHNIDISAEIEDDIYHYVAKNKPDVLALSMTQFLNGIYISPLFFKTLKQDFPDLKILIDATQYLGIEAFDFKNSNIDLLIASGYKWLNAGLGNAIVMISDALFEDLKPKQVGSNSLKDKTKQSLKPMGFIEPGHFDVTAIISLYTALDLHYHSVGIDFVSKQINEISIQAFEEFKFRNLLEKKVCDRIQHSNIFNLNINPKEFQKFEKHKILLSKRGNGLRVSFHYHNTIDDLNSLLAYIDHK